MIFQYWLARFVLATLSLPPRPLAERLARGYTGIFDLAIPRLRRIAYRNLAMALPDSDPKKITDGVFDSIARLLVSFARFPRIDKANVGEWIRYDGLHHYHEAKQRGRGVLFATAHLGNWELSAFTHALMTEPMHVVVRPLDNRQIDAMVEKRRRGSGNHLIAKKHAARAILKALAANEPVGALIDQNSSLEDGTFVEFFGIQACANVGFAKLAAHSGAAVIPGFALWSEIEQKYVLKFYPLVEISGDAAVDTARIQKILEGVIREHPEQWLWIHRRWKTRPPGEESLY